MKVAILMPSPIDTIGGVTTYTKEMLYAMSTAGIEGRAFFDNYTELLDFAPDVIWLQGPGLCGEGLKSARARRLPLRHEFLKLVYGVIPLAITSHSPREPITHKQSLKFYQDNGIKFAAIIKIEKTEPAQRVIDDTLSGYNCTLIRHPFRLDGKYFVDRSKFTKNICSSARFGSTKKSNIVLDVAALLPNFRFQMYSPTTGISWYRTVRGHPNIDKVELMGELNHYSDPYNRLDSNAFNIDLTFFHYKGEPVGGRTQYVAIEAMACGAIPIVFETWQWEGGYEGIWLPTPERRTKSSFKFDPELYASIIADAKYSYDLAVHNYQVLSEVCDPKLIGEQVRALFEQII